MFLPFLPLLLESLRSLPLLLLGPFVRSDVVGGLVNRSPPPPPPSGHHRGWLHTHTPSTERGKKEKSTLYFPPERRRRKETQKGDGTLGAVKKGGRAWKELIISLSPSPPRRKKGETFLFLSPLSRYCPTSSVVAAAACCCPGCGRREVRGEEPPTGGSPGAAGFEPAAWAALMAWAAAWAAAAACAAAAAAASCCW